MNKTELTKVVAEKIELTQKEAAAATQSVLGVTIHHHQAKLMQIQF
ncbi:hypothetical protein B4077_3285 [Bacillus cereus]|uniref:DNA-binding protein n=1 Tax=Bacillus cereus TaxID=1396 RepID=A0A0G8EDF8_BACCE|nr:hypothetical protein B4077_3285 [Bacillus cereus]